MIMSSPDVSAWLSSKWPSSAVFLESFLSRWPCPTFCFYTPRGPRLIVLSIYVNSWKQMTSYTDWSLKRTITLDSYGQFHRLRSLDFDIFGTVCFLLLFSNCKRKDSIASIGFIALHEFYLSSQRYETICKYLWLFLRK